MPKIFVLNNGGHDLTRAKEYGEIISITEGNISLLSTDRIEQEIMDCLKKNDYDPGVDYILPSGSVVIGIIAGIIIGAAYPPSTLMRMLLWDAKSRTYKKRDLII